MKRNKHFGILFLSAALTPCLDRSRAGMQLEGGYFNADSEYSFHVRAFNENGVSK